MSEEDHTNSSGLFDLPGGGEEVGHGDHLPPEEYADETQEEVTAPSQSDSTAKKKKMIKYAAIGVVAFFGVAIIATSYTKAQARKAAQHSMDLEDAPSANETPSQPISMTPPAQPIAAPAPLTQVASQVMPAPVSYVNGVSTQPLIDTQVASSVPAQPAVAAQAPEDLGAILSDFGRRITALEESIRTTNVTLMGMQHGASVQPKYPAPNMAHHLRKKPEQKIIAHSVTTIPNSATVQRDNARVESVVPTLTLSPVSAVPTVQVASAVVAMPVKVATIAPPVQSLNACDQWTVKGAVPGMAWIERNDKITVVKGSDVIPDVGYVVSIDARNFEVKTKSCTIR